MKKIYAFTLAEVLITLAIIGIVASLTIPSVIANYNREQTGIKLKKAYNTLNQAINQSTIENGNPVTWDYTLDKATFVEKYFLPYLKISKNCGVQNNKNCFTTAKLMNGKYSGNSFYSPGDNYKIILQDGTGVRFSIVNSKACNIQIDINGLKKPNIMGKDIFSFFVGNLYNYGSGDLYYYKKTPKSVNYFYPDGYGNNFSFLFSSGNMRGCNKAASHSGPQCTAIIMQNGWKVPDKKEYKKLCPNCPESDYPF